MKNLLIGAVCVIGMFGFGVILADALAESFDQNYTVQECEKYKDEMRNHCLGFYLDNEAELVGEVTVKVFQKGNVWYTGEGTADLFVEDGQEYFEVMAEFCRPTKWGKGCSMERKKVRVNFEDEYDS